MLWERFRSGVEKYVCEDIKMTNYTEILSLSYLKQSPPA